MEREKALDVVEVICPITPPHVVISVPHDGDELLLKDTSFKARENGVINHDLHTWKTARHIEDGTGICALIRALYPRKFVDVNRVPDEAVADRDLTAVYQAYHDTLERIVKQYARVHRSCLLIDLHGFRREFPEGDPEIVLGTQFRQTVSSDVDIRLQDFLTRNGFRVYYARQKGECGRYCGGYTVGRHACHGVDAIQIELSLALRQNTERRTQFATALREFICRYFGV